MFCTMMFFTVLVSLTMGQAIAKHPSRPVPQSRTYPVNNNTEEDSWRYSMEPDLDMMLTEDLSGYYSTSTGEDNISSLHYSLEDTEFPQYDIYGIITTNKPVSSTSAEIHNQSVQQITDIPSRGSSSSSNMGVSSSTSTSDITTMLPTSESTANSQTKPSSTTNMSPTPIINMSDTMLDVIGGIGPDSSWDKIQTDLQRLETLDIIFPRFGDLLKKIRSPQQYNVDCSCDENTIQHELEGLCPPCFIHNVYIYLTMAFEHFVQYLEMIKAEKSRDEPPRFRAPYENMRY